MKTIKLSNSDEIAMVDDADFERVNKHTWRLKRGGANNKMLYVATTVRIGKKFKTILLHRFIMQPKDGFDVHHVRGNKLDNQQSELEIIDHFKHSNIYYGAEARAYAEHVEYHSEPEPEYDYDSIPF